MKTKILLFIVVLFLFSCGKEKLPFQPKSISELTSNLNGDIKTLSEIRLTFAKAVANALEDVEFRDYLNKVSRENTDSFFNEIVFALHKDDIAVGNKTLEKVIVDALDKESKELFGSEYIEKVLKEDPLISLKIPDMFYSFKWKTEEYAPLVMAKTPVSMGDVPQAYVSYHYSGFMDLLQNHYKPGYFIVVVKYSEDYILYNGLTKLTEKGIPLFNMLPQLEKIWDKMHIELANISVKHPILQNFRYFKKRKASEVFIDVCEEDYVYYGEQLSNSCDNYCFRKCIDPNVEVNDVFEKVTIVSDGLISLANNGYGEDNIDIFFMVFLPNDDIIDEYIISGYRKSEYYGIKYNYKIDIDEERYEDLGKIVIPKVDVETIYTQNKDVYINHRFRKGWKEENDGFVMHDFQIIKFYDIVNLFEFSYGINSPNYKMFCTELIEIDQSPLGYCMEPQLDKYYNIVMVSLIHRY